MANTHMLDFKTGMMFQECMFDTIPVVQNYRDIIEAINTMRALKVHARSADIGQPRQGLLIVLEGANGVGKSSTIDAITKGYDFAGIPYSVYKFPDRNGKCGQRIDQYLKNEIEIKSTYDILDMFARNRDAVRYNIKRDITKGKVVICDRYIYSAIAYHIPQTVQTRKELMNYVRVIGYFDKYMPKPDFVYMICGNHLHKRIIDKKEIFHETDNTNRSLMLRAVIENIGVNSGYIKNEENRIARTVNQIVMHISQLYMLKK